ncbi:sensor domain-containing protein [Kitasatospora sp. NBC_01287]|uniref:sensor domain-containing protein n=1 Tax=Kitasatospora sp. NBC_01287 TaxID=2903573 RepID=UPI00225140E3|nr:sensor domain-containing protein [Kitasatospora sp. NBC_01287]MCX4747453.1 sensor domain-containing protein [Kitasatospora sp. NBC_01287]
MTTTTIPARYLTADLLADLAADTGPEPATAPAIDSATDRALSDGATRFWRAPFARETYREAGYVLTSPFLAAAGFTWTVVLFALGTGTLVTALGLPVLALMLAGARGLGAVERGRVARLLGARQAAPAPVRPARPGGWGRLAAQLTDQAGWRAAAYQVLMFPWHILSFCLTVTFWASGAAMAALPAYNWVFPHYVGWPGYKIFDYTSGGVRHAYYLTHFWQLAGVSVAGVLMLFLAARLTHALTVVSRRAAAALLAG